MTYKISDEYTSADIGLIVTAPTLEELFSDSLLGLIEIMVRPDDLQESRQIEINLKADNIEDLYYKWLAEILYIKDAHNFLPKKCSLKIRRGRECRLDGLLSGDSIDYDRQTIKIDVKAVTYYKFKIEKSDDIWHGEVVFDL